MSVQGAVQAKQLAVIEPTSRVENERDRLKADTELTAAQRRSARTLCKTNMTRSSAIELMRFSGSKT